MFSIPSLPCSLLRPAYALQFPYLLEPQLKRILGAVLAQMHHLLLDLVAFLR